MSDDSAARAVLEEQIARFRKAIEEHDGMGRLRMIAEGIAPIVVDACRAGMVSMLADLSQELAAHAELQEKRSQQREETR